MTDTKASPRLEAVEVGDLVQLRGGGPVLAVSAEVERDGRVPVLWFRQSELLNAKIPLGALERALARDNE